MALGRHGQTAPAPPAPNGYAPGGYAPPAPPAQAPSACPGNHYLTEVNKGSIRMQSWQGHLNEMHGRGYKLAHVFEQDGNTVQVYEHHYHP